ncbi:flagellar protein FlgN [Pseudomonas stutzeri]|nr:flagellar protein FlgN [Stutzerimonas stutzeri]
MSLAQHLARQSACVAQLLALLENEAQLLGSGPVDGERLTALAADKQALLVGIEQLESQRRHAQQRLGYGDDQAGAERAAADAGCRPAWLQLLAMARRAQRLNRLNGEHIRMRLEHNQRLLNFLHEAAGKGLYGPDGQSRHGRLGNLASHA